MECNCPHCGKPLTVKFGMKKHMTLNKDMTTTEDWKITGPKIEKV
jgi:hypothetical protein